jgi:hypothetical protein
MTNILFFAVGFVAGAVAMYLIARNSPEHFLKIKGYADKVDAMTREQLSKISKEKG